MATEYAPYNPAGATRTGKFGIIRPIPLEPDWHNHLWFERYQMDFVNKNTAENNGMISGGMISGDGIDTITPTGGTAFIAGVKIPVSTPGTHTVTVDGWTIVYITSGGAFVYGELDNTNVQGAIAPSDAVVVGYAVKGDGVFNVFSFANEIINSDIEGATDHVQTDITVGPSLLDQRVTNLETTFISSLSAGDKLLFLSGVILSAARDISSVGQVELWMDGPAVQLDLGTFDLTLGECSGYLGLTTSGGDLVLDGVTHGLIIDGPVAAVEGPNFSGSYCLNGVWNSVDANIQVLTQPDHIILTSAKQDLYANDDKILRVDADGVTFKKKDGTPVVITDNTVVKIDSIEQLTNDLHFDFDNSDIEVLRQFEIDTNGNKIFFDGRRNRINIHTTEDFDNGLESETEEDQRIVKNRNDRNIIWLNNRRIFSGSRPKEEPHPINIKDPYVISMNGFSYEGHELGAPVDVCIFKDWWLHWGGLDLKGDGSILIPPIFNPASGGLQRKVFSSDDAGRFMRFNTPIGGSTGVDPDVHSRTSPSTLAIILSANYASSASNEISGILDIDAKKLKIGARVADADLVIPQGSSKTTIISRIVHNNTDDNSIFLIDSETGGDVVVSATGNLTIDMSGNSGISHKLDAGQRITGDINFRSGAIVDTPGGVFDRTTATTTQEVSTGISVVRSVVDFDNKTSTSPNISKTSEFQTMPISYHRNIYLIQ